jgi:N-acetylglucosaminyldiphosphoundecaprenol N-acetyl-beta-D-mannosaminyltransferase
VNERALENLRLTYPGLDVTGWSPYGFAPDRAAEIANRLRALAPRVVFVCFGAPRSEIWVAENRYLLPSGVLVCAGADVDFLAGAKKRAPAFEPSRLWRRYLVRDLAFVCRSRFASCGVAARATETSPRDASLDGEPAVESPSA